MENFAAPGKGFIKKFIGDRAFYKSVVLLVLPVMVQQGITSFVNLLDNVMVGGLGTESISAVAIVNQLVFVFNLSIFGGLSGASIYTAQYAGVKDYDGVRHTLRFKLILGVIITAVAIAVFSLFGDTLISLYLSEAKNDPVALASTMREAKAYMLIALFGLFPFMLSQAFGSTLRENGEAVTPMISGVISLAVNLVLNWVLIYGKLGCPALGVRGAAIATVISRYVETGYLLIRAYSKPGKYPYLTGVMKSLRIPKEIVKKICITGAPLLANEFMWSAGTAIINQCYSVRGLVTVAAVNIAGTVWQIFAIIMMSMGTAISIMVGQKLGANDVDGARDTDRKLLFLDVALHILIGGIVIAISGVIPEIYNTEQAVKTLTTSLLIVDGLALPLHALTHASYFTIRSGGRTVLTMLFDSVFTWLIPLPLAFFIANYTSWGVVALFACVQFCDAVKLCIALPLLKSGSWARRVIV